MTWRTRPPSHFIGAHSKTRWNTKFAGTRAGYIDKVGRTTIGIDNITYVLPRVIWKLVTGDAPVTVDHWDKNPTNNAWTNLRDASQRQNCQNRWRGNRTGLPKGVRPIRNRFSATIFANGRNHFLGLFDTPEDAHEAYRAAAKRLHGEFADFGT